MNPLILIIARVAALAIQDSRPKIAAVVNGLVSLIQGGVNVDAHMATVAKKLESGSATDADFDDVEARISEESDAIRNA